MTENTIRPPVSAADAKRIAREQAKQAKLAEQERQFVERFDERQVERSASDLAAAVNAKLAQRDARLEAMIERDRQDRMREIERAGAMAEGDPMGDDPADLKIILLGDSAVGQHRDFLLRRVRQTKKLNGIHRHTIF